MVVGCLGKKGGDQGCPRYHGWNCVFSPLAQHQLNLHGYSAQTARTPHTQPDGRCEYFFFSTSAPSSMAPPAVTDTEESRIPSSVHDPPHEDEEGEGGGRGREGSASMASTGRATSKPPCTVSNADHADTTQPQIACLPCSITTTRQDASAPWAFLFFCGRRFSFFFFLGLKLSPWPG